MKFELKCVIDDLCNTVKVNQEKLELRMDQFGVDACQDVFNWLDSEKITRNLTVNEYAVWLNLLEMQVWLNLLEMQD